ncbi:MAG TPA: hypothetical protein VEP73_09135, partial [Actinomycetota bacterium]|nr:hypothetical protein [Actinomycetota bacterium]
MDRKTGLARFRLRGLARFREVGGMDRVTAGWRLATAILAVAGTLAPAPATAPPAPRASNTALVGHLDPGPGPYGDVWVHAGTAYLGSFRSRACATAPGGLTAVDVRDPARPRAVGRFAQFRGSDDEDVWVGHVRTSSFVGDLAATGV